MPPRKGVRKCEICGESFNTYFKWLKHKASAHSEQQPQKKQTLDSAAESSATPPPAIPIEKPVTQPKNKPLSEVYPIPQDLNTLNKEELLKVPATIEEPEYGCANCQQPVKYGEKFCKNCGLGLAWL